MGKEPPFRQAKSAQLAPDALLFINGSDKLKDDNENVYELRNNITDINVSLNIESTPGTASFTISIPDHSIRRSGDIRFDGLTLMSEVEIYFKGRFPNGDGIFPYYPAFWGLIISLVENYSDGVHTISVSCADILRWWEITEVVINPSLISAAEAQKFLTEIKGIPKKDHARYLRGELVKDSNGRDVSPYGNKYAGKTIPEILIDLKNITMKNIAPVASALDFTFGDVTQITSETKDKAERTPSQAEAQIMQYWQERLNQIGRSLRIFGLTQSSDGKFDFDEETFGDVQPYPLNSGSPNGVESIMKTQLEIANELKDAIHFEFFMDVNGEIIFKPPFYNLNVITNRNSIVEDLDILNWTFNKTEAEVYTRCDVTGSWSQAFITGKDVLKGIAIDIRLAQKFGIRLATREVNWIDSRKNCFVFAQGELNRLNAMINQGSVTITGRPELRLGYPIYVPARDAFYYVKGIDHSFSFGGSFTTTLTLVAERKRIYESNGVDAYKWGAYVNTDEIDDGNVSVEGGSIVDSDDNFIKQLNNPCLPTKGNASDIVEPNFAKNLDNLLSTAIGDWQAIKKQLSDDADTAKEYQFTDGDGYELVPFFKYGRDLVWSDESVVFSKPKKTLRLSELSQEEQSRLTNEQLIELTTGSITNDREQEILEKAKKAQTIMPQEVQMTVNPNNRALTLDPEFATKSMLYIFDSSLRGTAQKARDNDPEGNKS